MLIFTRHRGAVAIKYPRSYWNSRSYSARVVNQPRGHCIVRSPLAPRPFVVCFEKVVPCFVVSSMLRWCTRVLAFLSNYFLSTSLRSFIRYDRELVTDQDWPSDSNRSEESIVTVQFWLFIHEFSRGTLSAGYFTILSLTNIGHIGFSGFVVEIEGGYGC